MHDSGIAAKFPVIAGFPACLPDPDGWLSACYHRVSRDELRNS
jgi:hypothetical protein